VIGHDRSAASALKEEMAEGPPSAHLGIRDAMVEGRARECRIGFIALSLGRKAKRTKTEQAPDIVWISVACGSA
jgi:hypothetical protein